MIGRGGGSSIERRARALRWMDRWVDPMLVLLAASAVPLIIIQTGEPSAEDARFVVGATWAIWGAFAANLVLRLSLAPDRWRELRRLAPDLILIVGLPVFSAGESRKATPVFALVPLVVVGLRMLQRGLTLRRTGYTLRNDPVRIVAFVVPFVLLLSASLIWRFEQGHDTIDSVGDALWWGVVTLATVGYGDISPATTAGRFVAVGLMIVGISMFSIVTATIAERLLARRLSRGRGSVLETGHTLILGWSSMVLTIIEQLVIANASRERASIVVLADMDTQSMVAEIVAHVPDIQRSSTTLVCRQGDPIDPVDIGRCRPDKARSVIILDPTKQDAPVVRSLLAVSSIEAVAQSNVQIVAEIDDTATAKALEQTFGHGMAVVNPTQFVARTAAQACRAPGIAHAYLELLGFEGSEIYRATAPGDGGYTYGQLLEASPDACLIGLVGRDGAAVLNPPMDSVLGDGQEVLVVASDDSEISWQVPEEPWSGGDWVEPEPPSPEHVVVLGWSAIGPLVVNELDGFFGSGSKITVFADTTRAQALSSIPTGLSCCGIEVHTGPGVDTDSLVEILSARPADHVMVLCYSDTMSVAEADALALVTTLQVHAALDRCGHDASVVTELLDQRDVRLAPVTSAGDFLVSDRLVGLLLAQLSEDTSLKPVYDELLDPAGADMYCKPISRYCRPGEPVSFGELVRAACRRGESAIGYRVVSLANDQARHFGVVINPPKSAVTSFAAADQLVVVATDGS